MSKTHGLVMPLKPFIAYTTKSIKTQGPVTSLQPKFIVRDLLIESKNQNADPQI